MSVNEVHAVRMNVTDMYLLFLFFILCCLLFWFH